MSAPSLSNVFSDVYITGNCTVKGTISSLAGSITSQWTTSGSIIYYTAGNVGIGTATPGNILTISSSGVTVPLISSSAAGSASYINFTNSADSRSSFIGQDGTGLFAFSTGALALGTNSSVPIIFAPNYNSGGEKMRITPTGLVGIGTTNPGSLLTVSGGVGIGSGYQAFTAPTGGLIVQGNVGIGTSNPGLNALQVTGNVVTSGFTSNATNTVFNFDTLTVPFVNATQVGIGTSVPVERVDIRGGSISLGEYATGPVGSRYVGFGYNDGTSYRCIDGMEIENTTLGGNFSQKLHFRTHSYGVSEGRRLTIAEGGNVGIGTTNPGYTLDVNGSIRTTASLYYSSIRTSRTSLQTATATAFYPLIDISGGAYASKVTIHWNATPSAAAIAFYFIDAGGTNTGVSEYNISYFRAGAYSTGAGNAYVAISNETGTGGVCEFLISKVTGRAHFQTTSTYCWAGVGATRGQGQGYTTGNPNRIVLYSIPANNVDWWAVTENYYT